ncbi:MAG: choice-of-anchor Q domain-containing protein [Methanococcaceae archaeon]
MKFPLLLSLFLFLTCSQFYSKTYFIDSDRGNDNNNGISDKTPYKSWAVMQYTKLLPGDSVLFKKGSTWNETISITASGNPNNPIVFSSYGTGELPTIDIRNLTADGISINHSQDVIVDGFNVTNIGVENNNIYIANSRNCIARNCSLNITGRAGFFLEKDVSCTVADNYLITPAAMINNQTDGIYAQRNKGNVYDGNTIIDRNSSPEQHSDCIQLYLETDATVKNNYLEQRNENNGHAQGLYSTMPSGTHLYYNNVVFAPNTKAHLMAFLNMKKGNGKVKVFNNTLSGGFMNVFRTDTEDPIVKNNIFVTTCKCSMVRFDTTLSGSADVNNNIYYSNSTKPLNFIGKEYTFKDWQSMGHESEGKEGDPKLNKDFTLKSGSPCINAGSDLSIIFQDDKSGTQRLRKKKYDIGAYEFKGGVR